MKEDEIHMKQWKIVKEKIMKEKQVEEREIDKVVKFYN